MLTRRHLAFHDVKRLLAAYPNAKTLSLSDVVNQFPELGESAPPSVRGSGQHAGTASPGSGTPTPERRRRANPRAFQPEELQSLRAALERHQGNVASAAAELGISR